MDRKIKILALVSIAVVLAAFATSLILAEQSTVKADTTTQVASDATTPTPTPLAVTATDNQSLFGSGPMGFGGHNGTMGMFRGFGGPGGMMGGFGSIQVSSDFTQNVTNIVQNDSDVKNLLAQGFNITSIRPVISTVIDGNGNVTTSATTANVILQSTTGRALVVVDLTQAKVTKIVTTTTTVINK
jgi:hypothetical protein